MFRNCLSKSRNIHTGVPQGAVTSPTLFNFYVAKMPSPPDTIQLISYADDTTLAASGPKVKPLCDELNGYLPHMLDFFESRQLVSAEKSSVTLFTPHTAQANDHPGVYVHGSQIPLAKHPKILGVVHDTMYTFAPHGKYATTRARTRLNVLKALAGSNWGQQKETLITTYKAIGRSVAEYGAPIWSPQLSDTGWNKLQVVQNEALRIATGCHRMSAVDHLHVESKVLPLRAHATMLSQQYLISCHQTGHPCNDLVTAPAPTRNMKETLVSAQKGNIAAFVPSNQISKVEYKRAISGLHRATVHAVTADYTANRVLGRPPPDIDKAELQLERGARTTLSQLRSGYSKILNSYQSRISNTADVCPEPGCMATPHDVQHLFNCPQKATTLKPADLWHQPVEVARFLNL